LLLRLLSFKRLRISIIIEISNEYSLNGSCVTFEPHRFNNGITYLNKKEIGHAHCKGLADISSILNIENEVFKIKQDEIQKIGRSFF
jgi:hypothetical protein